MDNIENKDIYCIGCGQKLQTEDENQDGYVDPRALNREFILCKRCFRLQHYGKFNKANEIKDPIKLINKKAKKNDLIILVCDVSLVNSPLLSIYDKLSIYNNLIVVATRYDLYKNYIKIDKAYKFLESEFKKTKLNINKIFIIDDNIDEIFKYIDDNTKDHNAFLVGLENVGKTTFLNKILKNIAGEDTNFITSSKYPGTTINLVPINLTDNTFLYDSPGICSPGNMLHFVSNDFIKNQGFDDKITEYVYQLNKFNALIVSNLCVLEFLNGKRQSVIFYGSSMYDVQRTRLENLFKTFSNRVPYLKLKDDNYDTLPKLLSISYNIIEDYKVDLVIEGFGFFTLSKGEYVLHVPRGVNVYIRKAMI